MPEPGTAEYGQGCGKEEDPNRGIRKPLARGQASVRIFTWTGKIGRRRKISAGTGAAPGRGPTDRPGHPARKATDNHVFGPKTAFQTHLGHPDHPEPSASGRLEAMEKNSLVGGFSLWRRRGHGVIISLSSGFASKPPHSLASSPSSNCGGSFSVRRRGLWPASAGFFSGGRNMPRDMGQTTGTSKYVVSAIDRGNI